jgi:hypothetical protein
MKLTVVAFATLVLGVLLAVACGADDDPTVRKDRSEGEHAIESVVRAFYDAVLDGNLEAMERTLSDDMDPDTRSVLLSAFSGWQEADDALKDAIRTEDLTVREQGESAEVDVTFRAGSPETVSLILEPDGWRIVSAGAHPR